MADVADTAAEAVDHELEVLEGEAVVRLGQVLREGEKFVASARDAAHLVAAGAAKVLKAPRGR